jgi:predicted phage tail protein
LLNLDEKRNTRVTPDGPVAAAIESFNIWYKGLDFIGKFLVNLVVSTVVGMLVNAWRPKPEKPKYGWQAQDNSIGVGQTIPVVYGKIKTFGHIIQSYISTEGDNQFLHVLLALSEGPIKSVTDVRLNDQPVSNFGSDVAAPAIRLGTVDQAKIGWFNTVRNSRPVSYQLKDGVSHIYSTAAADVEKLITTLTFPNGLYYTNNSGDMRTNSVGVEVYYSPSGANTWTLFPYVTGDVAYPTGGLVGGEVRLYAKTRTRKSWTFSTDVLPADRYDVKVVRLSHDAMIDKYSTLEEYDTEEGTATRTIEPPHSRDAATSMHDMYFDMVDEINFSLATGAYANYPNTALLGMRIKANDMLSGGFPTISCVVEGREIKTWNGSAWVTAWSNNPAWIVYDLLTSTRYGLGNYITEAQVDQQSFKDFAVYCDEMAPTGTGSNETRHTCDIVLDEADRAWDVVTKLLSSARGMMIESDSFYKVYPEKPETISQVFTMGNIVSGSFTTAWANIKEEADGVEAFYYDKDREYERCSVKFPTSGATKVVQVDLPGVTRRTHAWREAAFRCNLITALSRSIEFDATLDAIACRVGDVIGVSHDVPLWGYSGRLKYLANDVSTTILTVDRTDLPFEGGKTYEILLRHEDDTIETLPVVNVMTDAAGVHVVVNGLLTVPTKAANVVYAYGEVSKSIKLFRVVSMTLNEDLTRHIQAIEYVSAVYTEISSPVPELPPMSALPDAGVIQAVRSLVTVERLALSKDGRYVSYVDVQWAPPSTSVSFYDHAEVYYRLTSDPSWTFAGYGYDSFSIGPILEGSYEVAVIAANKNGIKQAFDAALKSTITVVGKAAPPANVTGFTVGQTGLQLIFKWNPVADVDVSHYDIREGVNWGAGTVVATGVKQNYFVLAQAPAGDHTYWIKAIDTSGNSSVEATSAFIHVRDTGLGNLITAHDLTETLRLGTEAVSKNLISRLNGASYEILALGWLTDQDLATVLDTDQMVATVAPDTYECYVESAPIDLSFVSEYGVFPLITEEIYDAGDTTDTTFPERTDISYGDDTDVHITSELSSTHEIATSDDDVTYSDWTPFPVGDINARYAKIRRSVTLGGVTPQYKATAHKEQVYGKDIDETASGVAIAIDGGYTYAKEYHGVEYVRVTPIGAAFRVAVVRSKDATSCGIDLYDLAGTKVSGTADLQVHGY